VVSGISSTDRAVEFAKIKRRVVAMQGADSKQLWCRVVSEEQPSVASFDRVDGRCPMTMFLHT